MTPVKDPCQIWRYTPWRARLKREAPVRVAWKPALTMTLVAVVLATLAPIGTADPLPCADPMFRVETTDSVAHNLICAAASEAVPALATCGLVPTEPIEIATVEGPIHGFARCLAYFDHDLGRIEIVEPALLCDNLDADDPYAHLPNDVVFGSMLTHELAHALVQQNSEGRVVSLVDHEYIANALELAALDPQHRKTLLDAAGITPPVSTKVIDLLIYGLAPRRFAAAAYLHFEAFGCDTITGILDGTMTFQVDR